MVVQHGVAGVVAPESVYNHPAAVANPWLWAGIHGVFVVGMSGAGIVSWRLNETLIADVSRRRAALAEAQEVALLGSWERDPQTGETRWSVGLFRLLGLSPATTTPSRDVFLAHVHPDDREAFAACSEAAVGKGGSYDVEIRVVREDGTIRWLHARYHTPEGAEPDQALTGMSSRTSPNASMQTTSCAKRSRF